MSSTIRLLMLAVGIQVIPDRKGISFDDHRNDVARCNLFTNVVG
ncbi:MAG TPA: hypothetical protein VFA10_03505 [Ktedonobacteraceae bacterium]|nr:hypothetical protein [Ktedonobacteraceae bacterium]